jgi:hypothetical protein
MLGRCGTLDDDGRLLERETLYMMLIVIPNRRSVKWNKEWAYNADNAA